MSLFNKQKNTKRKKGVCPVCREKNDVVLNKIGMDGKLKRLLCKKCRCVYLEHDDFEPPVYNMQYNSEFFRPTDIRKAGIKACEIAQFIREKKEHQKILEVGGGNGLFTMLMGAMGFDITLLEIEMSTAIHLKEVIGINVMAGRFEDVILDPIFTFIYAAHVIEHCINPIKFLQSAKDKLKPKGLLYLETPDTQYITRGGPEWKHFRTRNNYEHVCMFTEYTFQYIADKMGFKIMRVCENPGYDSVDIVLRKENE